MSRVPARTRRGIVVAAAATAAATLLPAAPASAHANLVRATPADGAAVATAPARVVLTFDEDVRHPSTVVVTGPDGQRVQRGPTRVVDNTASVRLASSGGPGVYTVAFRVLSADGHPAAGQTTFSLLPAGGTASDPGPASSPSAAGHAHHQDRSAGPSSGLLAGGIAALGLLGGLALLTVRRRTAQRPEAGGP